MKCSSCNLRTALFRTNPKGEKGIFKCIQCLTEKEFENLDSEVKEIVEIIQNKGNQNGT